MSEFINTIDAFGDENVLNALIDGTLTEFKDDVLTSVGVYAFIGQTNLKTVMLPNVTRIGESAFYGCSSLETVDLGKISYLAEKAFAQCYNLKTIVIRSSAVPDDQSSTVFAGVYLTNGTCHIYVPRDLIDTYKATEYWWMYPNAYRALEDYTVDGTTTGALDPAKTGS
jgi:hypothetical protein